MLVSICQVSYQLTKITLKNVDLSLFSALNRKEGNDLSLKELTAATRVYLASVSKSLQSILKSLKEHKPEQPDLIEVVSAQFGKLKLDYTLLHVNYKSATFIGLPSAMKEAARKIFKNAKTLKVENCSEVAMATVAIYLAKHKFKKPLLEMGNVPPFIQVAYKKMILAGEDLFQ